MKRFIAILLAAVIFSASAAQAQIIHIKSTTIEKTKREKPKRERKTPPLKLGYRGFVEADFASDFSDFNSFGITTTHGCQLNDYLFIGAGIGIVWFEYGYYYHYYHYDNYFGIPLYADLKCYFMRNARVKPFAEIHGGIDVVEGVGLAGLSIGLECKNLFLKAGIEYCWAYFPIRIGIGYSF